MTSNRWEDEQNGAPKISNSSHGKGEDFLDLSINVAQNTSITHRLRDVSNTETLCSEQTYYCDTGCSTEKAQKRMRVTKLPVILALHLTQFEYMVHQAVSLSGLAVVTLAHSTSSDAMNLDCIYDLVAEVAHCGSGPNGERYLTIVKSHGFGLWFDDAIVEKMDDRAIEEFYGLKTLTKLTQYGAAILLAI
ncbi:hypothetical protein PANDA_013427 [Ailuropoda melanoleuca]|uniref:ubiquitinyl hydrolase 1 n=1 Tax=Ailuropoda melanoleuca TaxID=9646 RepID=D2HNX0_AILME|nr:hypothetical protein PANDA_013427 [Ailuropoda melanoleuca]